MRQQTPYSDKRKTGKAQLRLGMTTAEPSRVLAQLGSHILAEPVETVSVQPPEIRTFHVFLSRQ